MYKADPLVKILIIIGLIFYVGIGIVTFGNSAAYNDKWYAENCNSVQKRIEQEACYGGSAVPGFVAAVFWPFYWSWKWQE